MLTAMASELNVLAHALNRISERDRRYRDFTLNSCRDGAARGDRLLPGLPHLHQRARRRRVRPRGACSEAIAPRAPPQSADGGVDLRVPRRHSPDRAGCVAAQPTTGRAQERLHFAMKVQQFTGPVQAKGVEDTAFYRYHVLVSANDVGGHPGRLGVDARRNSTTPTSAALESWPAEMITTATHDTKRGEDARMRINVLSEIARRVAAGGVGVDAHQRPPSLQESTASGRPIATTSTCSTRRCSASGRRAPASSRSAPERAAATWSRGSAPTCRRRFARRRCTPAGSTRTRPTAARWRGSSSRPLDGSRCGALSPLVRAVAAPRRPAGMLNSLAQLVLKLTSPGVAGFLPGERAVGSQPGRSRQPPRRRLRAPAPAARRRAAADRRRSRTAATPAPRPGRPARALGGRPHQAVRHRRRRCAFAAATPRWCSTARTCPLPPDGPAADHLVAFARHHPAGTLMAVVPRLVASLTADDRPLPLGESTWTSTMVSIASFCPEPNRTGIS